MAPPVKDKVFLNCDMGEGFGNYAIAPDDDLLPYIHFANVACGFHASDPLVMQATVRSCKAHHIEVGAHPGLPDIQGFGRREMKLTSEELTAMTIYQVGALIGFLDREGMKLHHVKPHGALYGMMCRDYDTAMAVMRGCPSGVPVFGLAGTNMEKAANDLGLEFWAELYADVKYNSDGMLVIDRKKKAWKSEDIQARVKGMLESQTVVSVDDQVVEIDVNRYPVSVCCHSDSPGCLDIIKVTRAVIDDFNKGR